MNEGSSAPEPELIERVLNGIEYLAVFIEVLAVSVMAVSICGDMTSSSGHGWGTRC